MTPLLRNVSINMDQSNKTDDTGFPGALHALNSDNALPGREGGARHI